MTKKRLCLAFIVLPCMAIAEDRGVRETLENREFYRYEEKLKIDEKRRERIREETRKEIDGGRTLEHGDPCLIAPSLPGCGSTM